MKFALIAIFSLLSMTASSQKLIGTSSPQKIESGSSWKTGDTVHVAISVPATMERNSIERGKKIAELQKKFSELQGAYNELMRQNKDDFNILMEIAKIDSSKVYRSKEGAPLISIKSGLLIFKTKP